MILTLGTYCIEPCCVLNQPALGMLYCHSSHWDLNQASQFRL